MGFWGIFRGIYCYLGEFIMSNVTKISLAAKKELKRIFAALGITHIRDAADMVYLDTVDKNANKDDLDRHHDMFKKKLTHQRPDDPCAYLYYFQHKLDGEVFHDAAKKAAYDFIIEIKTRVTFIKLIGGTEERALESVYELFEHFRSISKKYGLPASEFFKLFNPYVNETLRTFTSKWHGSLSEEKRVIFRDELEQLRLETKSFLKKTEKSLGL
jgi:hypothetical protein